MNRIMPKPLKCRCGHEWYPKSVNEPPRICPKCKSANWDRPFKFRRPETLRRLAEEAGEHNPQGGS